MEDLYTKNIGTMSEDLSSGGSFRPVIFTKDSIFDKPFNYICSFDIEVLKNIIVAELEHIGNYPSNVRDDYYNRMFNRIFSFSPSSPLRISDFNRENVKEVEHRLFADLIAIPEIYNNEYIRDFFENRFYCDEEDLFKKSLVRVVFDFYSNNNSEDIEKFNYIFRSSDCIADGLMREPYLMSFYFNHRVLSSMTKDTLSLLYRFHFSDSKQYDSVADLIDDRNAKTLFLVGCMAEKQIILMGHCSEFLDSCLHLLQDKKFTSKMESLYDELIASGLNEDDIRYEFLSSKSILAMNYMMDYICNKINGGIVSKNQESSEDILSFIKACMAVRNRNHSYILRPTILDNIDKIDYFIYDPKYFCEINSEEDLNNFKEGFFRNVYGIGYSDALYLTEKYCSFLDDFDIDSMSRLDMLSLDVLTTFKNVVMLNKNDPLFEKKLIKVQMGYLIHLHNMGKDMRYPFASYSILEGLFNNLYLNTYNKILTKKQDFNKIKVDRDVEVLDAGVDFNMVITSLNGVGNLFKNDLNSSSIWNTASLSIGQGLCTSFINNENMGIIDVNSPILAFTDIPINGLDNMGPNDIYSDTSVLNLRQKAKDVQDDVTRLFIPGNRMADETRYGYNEILLDRFIMNNNSSSDNKLQPSHVVYYKFSEDYEKTDLYNECLGIAKDFDIPLVVIDYYKVKENEEREIRKEIKELFSNPVCDEKKVIDIVERLMNNYSGSLTFTRSGAVKKEDFSVGLMKEFFDDYGKFLINGNRDLVADWIVALERAYKEEKRKNSFAHRSATYKYALNSFEFFLDDEIQLEHRISNMRSINSVEIVDTSHYDDYYRWDDDSSFIDLNSNPETAYVSSSLFDFSRAIPTFNQLVSSDLDFLYGQDLVFEEVELTSSEVAMVKSIIIKKDEITDELKTVLSFCEELDIGTKMYSTCISYTEKSIAVYAEELKDKEKIVAEDLIYAYMFGNFKGTSFSDLWFYDLNGQMQFTLKDDFNIVDAFGSSKFLEKFMPINAGVEYKFNMENFEPYIKKIEEMEPKKLIDIFKPLIEKDSEKTGRSFEEVASVLLSRKDNIRENFVTLGNHIDAQQNRVETEIFNKGIK